jgi:hypothetical protein
MDVIGLTQQGVRNVRFAEPVIGAPVGEEAALA